MTICKGAAAAPVADDCWSHSESTERRADWPRGSSGPTLRACGAECVSGRRALKHGGRSCLLARPPTTATNYKSATAPSNPNSPSFSSKSWAETCA